MIELTGFLLQTLIILTNDMRKITPVSRETISFTFQNLFFITNNRMILMTIKKIYGIIKNIYGIIKKSTEIFYFLFFALTDNIPSSFIFSCLIHVIFNLIRLKISECFSHLFFPQLFKVKVSQDSLLSQGFHYHHLTLCLKQLEIGQDTGFPMDKYTTTIIKQRILSGRSPKNLKMKMTVRNMVHFIIFTFKLN